MQKVFLETQLKGKKLVLLNEEVVKVIIIINASEHGFFYFWNRIIEYDTKEFLDNNLDDFVWKVLASFDK